MDSVAVRKVNQLPSAEKRSLERLVGRQLEDNQQVFILTFTPAVVPTDGAREGALLGLAQTWKTVEEHGQKNAATEEEFDAAVGEAVNHVRRGQH